MRHIATFALVILIGNTAFAVPAASAPPAVTTVTTATSVPVSCPPGMACTTFNLPPGSNPVGVVVSGPTVAPCATATCPAAPATPPAETCGTDGCAAKTATQSGFWGFSIREILWGLIALALIAGGIYLLKGRHDNRKRRRVARFYAAYRSASRRTKADPKNLDLAEAADVAWYRYAAVADSDDSDDSKVDSKLPPPPPAI